LLVTVVITFAAGCLAGLVWQMVFGFELPAYVAGLVGGLATVPTWHFLKRIRLSVS
jgi:hypothetical protein